MVGVGQLVALHSAVLRWVLAAPRNMRSAALYLLAGNIPLQGYIVKQQIQYFGQLQFEQA